MFLFSLDALLWIYVIIMIIIIIGKNYMVGVSCHLSDHLELTSFDLLFFSFLSLEEHLVSFLVMFLFYPLRFLPRCTKDL